MKTLLDRYSNVPIFFTKLKEDWWGGILHCQRRLLLCGHLDMCYPPGPLESLMAVGEPLIFLSSVTLPQEGAYFSDIGCFEGFSTCLA